jgi:hypothetical protein
VRLDRRKDSEYRVAYQASHQGGSKFATAVQIGANAQAVKGDTTLPIPHQQLLRVRSSEDSLHYTVSQLSAYIPKANNEQ